MPLTERWIVRLWDGFDGLWMDVSKPMAREAAERLAGDKNEENSGKRDAGYDDIDYYAAFPADTTMHFSRAGAGSMTGRD